MELVTVTTASKFGGHRQRYSFRALVIGEETEGETTYTIALSQYGGIWYKGDWVTDKWNSLSESSFRERFPELAHNILDDEETIQELHHRRLELEFISQEVKRK